MTGPSPRSTVRRGAARAAYDRDSVHAILDAGFLCHLGVVVDGAPRVIPTCYGRDGDVLLLHGSTGSRSVRESAQPVDICVAVTHVDGLVLARSALHHSVNYRSVVVHGRATRVAGDTAKLHALEVITDHVVPGRWAGIRKPDAKELAATAVLALSLGEASAKVRSGPPVDDPEDADLAVWAGVVPLRTIQGAPQPDPLQAAMGLDLPDHARSWRRPG